MLTCGARAPIACIAPAVHHVQLRLEEGGVGEIVLCQAHLDELEVEFRHDWHPLGRWCAYPWRAWDSDGRRCVEDESDDSVRSFTIEELTKLLDDDQSHLPQTDPEPDR